MIKLPDETGTVWVKKAAPAWVGRRHHPAGSRRDRQRPGGLADCGFAVVVKLALDKLEDEGRFPDGRFAEQDEFAGRRDRSCCGSGAGCSCAAGGSHRSPTVRREVESGHRDEVALR